MNKKRWIIVCLVVIVCVIGGSYFFIGHKFFNNHGNNSNDIISHSTGTNSKEKEKLTVSFKYHFYNHSNNSNSNPDLKKIKHILKKRLTNLGIKSYDVSCRVDEKNLIYEFEIKLPESAVKSAVTQDQTYYFAESLVREGRLEFYEGDTNEGTPFMNDDAVEKATAVYDKEHGYVVQLKFNKKGAAAFYTATSNASMNGTNISIYMDDENISSASCQSPITGGEAIIYGNFEQERAEYLASIINAGSLPGNFVLSSTSKPHRK